MALGDDRPSSTTEYCLVPFISLTVILLSFTSAQYNFLYTASSQINSADNVAIRTRF